MSAPLILASRSPRRARLLKQAGYAYEQADPPFADPPRPDEGGDPENMTVELARQKAMSLRDAGALDANLNAVILAADTVCVDEAGRNLGQPRDRDDAETMLRRFLGRTHRVVTGVALLARGDAEPESFADTAIVKMSPIPDHQLETYLDTNQWQGKAGGYNLADRLRAGWPIDVDGDPATVVGLPMRQLAARLERRGVVPRSA